MCTAVIGDWKTNCTSIGGEGIILRVDKRELGSGWNAQPQGLSVGSTVT